MATPTTGSWTTAVCPRNCSNFQYLGVRTFANQTELNYRFDSTIAVFAGYNYFNRRIRSIENVTVPGGGTPDSVTGDQTNQVHEGTLGVRLRPIKPLLITVDGDIGRASRPIYPTSDRDYQILGARVQYKIRNFTFSAQARSNYNTNSVRSARSVRIHAPTPRTCPGPRVNG